MAVELNTEKKTLTIPDLGVTMRTIMAVAASGYAETKNRSWKIIYKGAHIGTVKVKDDHLKRSTHVANSNGPQTVRSPAKITSRRYFEKAVDGTNLAVRQGPSGCVVITPAQDSEGGIQCGEFTGIADDEKGNAGS